MYNCSKNKAVEVDGWQPEKGCNQKAMYLEDSKGSMTWIDKMKGMTWIDKMKGLGICVTKIND